MFTGGAKTPYEIPQLPNTPLFSNKLDIYDLFWESDFSQLTYKAFLPDSNSFVAGSIDEHGRTGKINTSDPSKVQILVGSEDDWGISIEGFDEEDYYLESQSSQSIENKNEGLKNDE